MSVKDAMLGERLLGPRVVGIVVSA